ncbi:MAG: hypothetical protein ACJ798_15260 [Phenylobacterium sp.]
MAAGLLLGGAMHPNLDDDGRPIGPQIIAGSSGMRAIGSFDSAMRMASYNGKIPDYVLGTDWNRMTALPEPAAVAPPARELARNDDPPPEPATYVRADYEEPPLAPHGRYPSMGGAEPHAPTGEAVDAADQAPAIAG